MSITAIFCSDVRMKPPLSRVCRTLISDTPPFDVRRSTSAVRRSRAGATAGPAGGSGYDRGFIVPERPAENTHRGPLRAFYEWLAGATSPPEPTPERVGAPADILPARFAHYTIARKLGEG